MIVIDSRNQTLPLYTLFVYCTYLFEEQADFWAYFSIY